MLTDFFYKPAECWYADVFCLVLSGKKSFLFGMKILFNKTEVTYSYYK